MSLETGSELLHYRILGPLGEGGMGRVYLAEDTRLHRKVAIKVLSAVSAEDPVRLARLHREATSLAALNHPNIVTIHAVEEWQGTPFLAMELVEGRTLEDAIPAAGFDLDAFFEIALPLIDATAAAHDCGVLHRDLKPRNVMVDRHSRVKVLDFGVAKSMSDATEGEKAAEPLTEDGMVLGTVPYMAPEQLRGEPMDVRSDIFSLGVTLYQMLSGARPFRGESRAELTSAILRDDPPDFLRPDLPKRLVAIVRRALAKDPSRRYQTAADLHIDLEDLRTELTLERVRLEPTISDQDSPTGSSRKRSRRGAPHLRWILPALAAVVLAAVAALFVPWQARSSSHPLSLAVLPFANLLGDPGEDHLCQGLSAGVLTRLGELDGVRVVGRAETWSVAARDSSLRHLAKELSIDAVLEGEVSSEPRGLVVDARLTDAESGVVLWSRRFSQNRAALPGFPRRIAGELADWLALRLSQRERRRLARDPTRSLPAYDTYTRATALLDDGDVDSLERAAAAFREAVRLDDGFALAWVGLAEAQIKLYGLDPDPRLPAEAKEAIDRALRLDEDLPAALVLHAELLRVTGRARDSITELEGLLHRHPKPDEAYRQLANSYVEAGDLEQAERCLQVAVTLGEEVWSNWNALGSVQLQAGKYERARRSFERAARLVPPETPWPQANLGVVALYEGNFTAAVAIFSALGPDVADAELASNMGTAYFYVGELDKAQAMYSQAIELRPNDAALHRNLADLYARRGRDEEARREYAEALRLVERSLSSTPENPRLRLVRALYAAKAGQCDLGVAQARDLRLSLSPTAETAHRLAQTFAVCGERDDAIAALRQALALGRRPDLLAHEDEFRSLRDDPDFETLMNGGL